MSADREYVSQIALMDGATGQALPSTAMGIVLLSSAGAGWRGITVERHRRGPREMPESYIPAHGVSICTGTESIDFGWQEGGRWRDRTLNPTQFHLVTNGELNRPRWLGTLDEVSLVLDPCFVADLVRDGLPPDRVAFASQRFAYDPTIVHYAEAFCAELRAGADPDAMIMEFLETTYVAAATLGRWDMAALHSSRERFATDPH